VIPSADLLKEVTSQTWYGPVSSGLAMNSYAATATASGNRCDSARRTSEWWVTRTVRPR
jgi:hypothetical protein